jgi:hypothetical protein
MSEVISPDKREKYGMLTQIRGILVTKPELSPDEVFGTHS